MQPRHKKSHAELSARESLGDARAATRVEIQSQATRFEADSQDEASDESLRDESRPDVRFKVLASDRVGHLGEKSLEDSSSLHHASFIDPYGATMHKQPATSSQIDKSIPRLNRQAQHLLEARMKPDFAEYPKVSAIRPPPPPPPPPPQPSVYSQYHWGRQSSSPVQQQAYSWGSGVRGRQSSFEMDLDYKLRDGSSGSLANTSASTSLLATAASPTATATTSTTTTTTGNERFSRWAKSPMSNMTTASGAGRRGHELYSSIEPVAETSKQHQRATKNNSDERRWDEPRSTSNYHFNNSISSASNLGSKIADGFNLPVDIRDSFESVHDVDNDSLTTPSILLHVVNPQKQTKQQQLNIGARQQLSSSSSDIDKQSSSQLLDSHYNTSILNQQQRDSKQTKSPTSSEDSLSATSFKLNSDLNRVQNLSKLASKSDESSTTRVAQSEQISKLPSKVGAKNQGNGGKFAAHKGHVKLLGPSSKLCRSDPSKIVSSDNNRKSSNVAQSSAKPNHDSSQSVNKRHSESKLDKGIDKASSTINLINRNQEDSLHQEFSSSSSITSTVSRGSASSYSSSSDQLNKLIEQEDDSLSLQRDFLTLGQRSQSSISSLSRKLPTGLLLSTNLFDPIPASQSSWFLHQKKLPRILNKYQQLNYKRRARSLINSLSHSSVFALYTSRYAREKLLLALRLFRNWYHAQLTYHKLSRRMEFNERQFDHWFKRKGSPLQLRALDKFDQIVIWIAGEYSI